MELGGVVKLFDYNGLNDLCSWSKILLDYGRPDPKRPNPGYRVIAADSEETISHIVAKLTS